LNQAQNNILMKIQFINKIFEIQMTNNTKKNMTSFSEHLDLQYGKHGNPVRDEYEQEFEAFKFGVVLKELRKEKGLSQAELAQKCGTTTNYISKIENHSSDIKLSSLMKIINNGFGGHLKLSVEFK
jgi:HTH-type transcriptional regulator / antitoxin HipB